jgi:hypothetical protein
MTSKEALLAGFLLAIFFDPGVCYAVYSCCYEDLKSKIKKGITTWSLFRFTFLLKEDSEMD